MTTKQQMIIEGFKKEPDNISKIARDCKCSRFYVYYVLKLHGLWPKS
jgi:hypothetical protein